jgi:hypothetical protein
MFNIGPNTQVGVDLAQQGRNAEALPYLRRAVTTEIDHPEVWLWLAHVSPDIAEYRNCVYQALRLNPDHPTAQRMQQDIDLQAYGSPPPVAGADAARHLDQPHARRRRFRRILILMNIIALVTVCGWASTQYLTGVDSDDINSVLPLREDSKRIRFSVGEESVAYNFQVDIPETWFLADVGSPSWRAERDRLQQEFPPPEGEGSVWQNVEFDLGLVEREPLTGEYLQSVAIIETDSQRIAEEPDAVAILTLVAVQMLSDDNSCESLRELASEEETSGSTLNSFIAAEVREREAGDCVYFSQFSDTNDQGAETRFFRIIVPINEQEIAVWQARLPAGQYEDQYRAAIDRIIDTLLFFIPADA